MKYTIIHPGGKIAEKIGFGTLVLLFVVNYGSSQVKIDEVLEPVDTRGVGAPAFSRSSIGSLRMLCSAVTGSRPSLCIEILSGHSAVFHLIDCYTETSSFIIDMSHFGSTISDFHFPQTGE